MSFLTSLLEQYSIMESLDSVIKSNPAIPEQTIRDYHQHALPDNNKSDKLLSHVLKLHKTGEITTDRAAELKTHLTALHLSNQLNKISSLKTLDDHKNATVGMNTNTKKENIDANTKILPSPNDIILKQHLNHESAVKGAMLHPENPMYTKTREPGKAQWCLSVGGETGKAHYDNYTEYGDYPLYTIHDKKTKRTTAFVADPTKDKDDIEIRDEKDTQHTPYHVLVNNPSLEHTVVGDFIKRHHPDAIESLRKLPHNASEHDVTKALSGNDYNLQIDALSHPAINSDHLMSVLKHNTNPEIQLIALKHPKIDNSHITTILNDKNPLNGFIRSRAVAHPLASESNITDVLADKSDDSKQTRINAIKHNNATVDHITDLLANDPSDIVKSAAFANKKATADHIKSVLSPNSNAGRKVKQAALYHHKVNMDHITMALKDEDSAVVESAKRAYNKLNNQPSS